MIGEHIPSPDWPRQQKEDSAPKLSSFEFDIGANLLGAFLVLGICALFVPSALPFGLFKLWEIRGSLGDWLLTALPLIIWGPLLTIAFTLWRGPNQISKESAEEVFLRGACSSLFAGIAEEVLFRWIFFSSSIAVAMFVNWLFFGWVGFGIVAAIHIWLFGPVANWLTLGYLNSWLVNPHVWFIGAGLISSNTIFRNGHAYQGWVGLINSWFGGMFFFFLLFKYGLVACMVCHFLYDFAIDVTNYVLRKLNIPRPMTIADYLDP